MPDPVHTVTQTPRVNAVVVIVGDRGTGKTTLIQGNPAVKVTGILPTLQSRRPGRKVLIVETFDDPLYRHLPPIMPDELPAWTAGPRRIWSARPVEMLSAINAFCYNTVIVVEDSTKFIFGRLPEPIKQMVLNSKQQNNDLYFIFHYLQAVPPDLARLCDYLVLFKTKETWDARLKTKYPNPDIEQLFLKVKKARSWYYHDFVKISG